MFPSPYVKFLQTYLQQLQLLRVIMIKSFCLTNKLQFIVQG